MNRKKRELLMQKLPAATDILALVPEIGTNGETTTIIHTAGGGILRLTAGTDYLLSCLAEREDKEIRLIRRNAARLLARRRNIVLPSLYGCVLAPIMIRPAQKYGDRLGYVNIAHRPLVAAGRGGTDLALRSGIVLHTLWQPTTVKKLVHEGRAVHYKLIVDAQQQLRRVEEFA